MSANLMPSNALDVPVDSYIVLGLATCFIKEDGKLQSIKIVEPIPSAAFEALCKGIETSYELAIATTLETAFVQGQGQVPASFPADVQLCEAFEERLMASARSYRSCASLQSLLPLGQSKTDFNFSVERKRMLNVEREIRTEDNVKQHAYTHQVL
jgi:hypothetical protein